MRCAAQCNWSQGTCASPVCHQCLRASRQLLDEHVSARSLAGSHLMLCLSLPSIPIHALHDLPRCWTMPLSACTRIKNPWIHATSGSLWPDETRCLLSGAHPAEMLARLCKKFDTAWSYSPSTVEDTLGANKHKQKCNLEPLNPCLNLSLRRRDRPCWVGQVDVLPSIQRQSIPPLDLGGCWFFDMEMRFANCLITLQYLN
ncbi:hypothetical protein GGI42DRAFT_175751 [Trichoderma sp. SZMC 28013]